VAKAEADRKRLEEEEYQAWLAAEAEAKEKTIRAKEAEK